jgi:hypothetical protein
MNYSSNDEAQMWAENLAESEDEAFEQALKRISPQKVIDALTDENATLRIQIARLNDENRRLREALLRQTMDNYEYE